MLLILAYAVYLGLNTSSSPSCLGAECNGEFTWRDGSTLFYNASYMNKPQMLHPHGCFYFANTAEAVKSKTPTGCSSFSGREYMCQSNCKTPDCPDPPAVAGAVVIDYDPKERNYGGLKITFVSP